MVGRFDHVERVVAERRPEAIILLSDIQAPLPFGKALGKVLDKTEVWFIPSATIPIGVSPPSELNSLGDAKFR